MTAGPRVMQVIAPAEHGGSESVVKNLAVSLGRRGAHVVVASVGTKPSHPWTRSLQAAGVDVVHVGEPGRRYRSQRLELRRLTTARQPAVVHSHGYHADLLCRTLTRGEWAWVSTVHGYIKINLRNDVYQWLDRRALRGAARVIAVASHIAEDLVRSGLSSAKVSVIPNAVTAGPSVGRQDARDMLGLDRTGTVLGWVGRVSHEKGPDRLLQLVPRLSRDVTVVVVGEGPLRAELEDETRRLGLSARLRWVGARPDARALMPAFDALLLTSRTEGTPMVVLEAMAVGVPVIATRVGGVPAMIPQGTGWLVDEADCADIGRYVERLVAFPAEGQAYGDRARRHVQSTYSDQSWTDAHLALYRQMVSGGR